MQNDLTKTTDLGYPGGELQRLVDEALAGDPILATLRVEQLGAMARVLHSLVEQARAAKTEEAERLVLQRLRWLGGDDG